MTQDNEAKSAEPVVSPNHEIAGMPETELPTFSEDGVDLTLIRWMLSLTPLERLRVAQRYANSAARLRRARKRI